MRFKRLNFNKFSLMQVIKNNGNCSHEILIILISYKFD